MKTVRVGQVGSGFIGQVHAKSFQSLAGVEVVAQHCNDSARGKAHCAKLGVPDRYESYEEMLARKDIDVISIGIPNYLHAEFALKAIAAGKHVICEKPMALNSQECREMIAACRAAGRQLSIGYRLRFDPFHQEAIRIARENVFGTIKLVEASFGFNMRDSTTWRFKLKEGGGGALMDLGVYCVEAARYLTGENPTRVTAQAYTFEKERFTEVPEMYCFQMEFPRGAVSSHTVSYSSYVDRLYAVAAKAGGGGGWLELEPAFLGGPNAPIGRTSEGPMKISRINQTTAQMDDFARCILDNRPTRVPGEEGLADMIVIDAIKAAARAGKPTRIAMDNLAADREQNTFALAANTCGTSEHF